jgi:hypothetical protein
MYALFFLLSMSISSLSLSIFSFFASQDSASIEISGNIEGKRGAVRACLGFLFAPSRPI